MLPPSHPSVEGLGVGVLKGREDELWVPVAVRAQGVAVRAVIVHGVTWGAGAKAGGRLTFTLPLVSARRAAG